MTPAPPSADMRPPASEKPLTQARGMAMSRRPCAHRRRRSPCSSTRPTCTSRKLRSSSREGRLPSSRHPPLCIGGRHGRGQDSRGTTPAAMPSSSLRGRTRHVVPRATPLADRTACATSCTNSPSSPNASGRTRAPGLGAPGHLADAVPVVRQAKLLHDQLQQDPAKYDVDMSGADLDREDHFRWRPRGS